MSGEEDDLSFGTESSDESRDRSRSPSVSRHRYAADWSTKKRECLLMCPRESLCRRDITWWCYICPRLFRTACSLPVPCIHIESYHLCMFAASRRVQPRKFLPRQAASIFQSSQHVAQAREVFKFSFADMQRVLSGLSCSVVQVSDSE